MLEIPGLGTQYTCSLQLLSRPPQFIGIESHSVIFITKYEVIVAFLIPVHTIAHCKPLLMVCFVFILTISQLQKHSYLQRQYLLTWKNKHPWVSELLTQTTVKGK
jgi:hypothetical protein